jgi:hypothetical protein
MAKEADRLVREIEATRKDLVRDVDRLTEHASPTRLVGRRLERMREGMRSLKDRVIGVSEDAASTVADVGGAVHEAPKKLAKVAQGSPVGVGLIAFGGGMLAAALIPESPAERRAVRQLSENLAPVLEPLQEAGRALAGDVRSTVETAAGEVRSTAADSAGEIRAAAVDAAGVVRTAIATGATDVGTVAREGATRTLQQADDQRHALFDQTRRGLDN